MLKNYTMKTKLFFFLFLAFSSINFAQTKETKKENQKFYFPSASFSNPKDLEKNLNNLVLEIAPLEINEKTQTFSDGAETIYLLQKNYQGLENYSKNKNFPKESLPFKSFAEAMIADPTQGNQFKKTFTENFSRDFNKMNGPAKTNIAKYFDEKMVSSFQKMANGFIDQLSKKKTDSLSYTDAKKLIAFESQKRVNSAILPLGKNIVKDYIVEFFQPFITGPMWISVVKPKEVNDLPDVSKDYKILFEITNFSTKNTKETAYKTENSSLIEAGRIMNLHVASGISPEKLHIVVVVHGSAIDFLLNNNSYKEKYKVENPNLSLIKQMQSKGVKFVVCGQLMTWDGLTLNDLTENVKEAFSAKTALSNYQTQGFVLYQLNDKD